MPILERVGCLALAVVCVTPLVIASRLTPDPSGYGTHTELHMQPCEFFQRTGWPCPGCGMTTSFTWLAHGNVVASLWVQPMGTVLAVLAGLTFWASLYIAITGRPVHRLLHRLPGMRILITLLFFGLFAWGWKMFVHKAGIDGWG